jgi:cell division protein ZapD
MPEYGHWLRQPYKRRQKDLFHWISTIKPICETSSEILLIIRNSTERMDKMAKEGMYQHTNKKNQQNQILRISLEDGGNLFPEISGNQQRFTIRFLEWSTTDNRAMQSANDVKFKISIC